MVNVTNGKIIRLLVDDEPFDVRYGELREHERSLDFRAGRAAAGGRVDLAGEGRACGSPPRGSCRSCTRAVAAILYEVEPLDERGPARRAVGAGGQRAAAGRDRGATRVPEPASSAALGRSSSRTTRMRVVLATAPTRAGC